MGDKTPLNGQWLESLCNIDISGRDKRLDKCDILAASDVDNPLFGSNGTAYIYSAQKGVDDWKMEYVDKNLKCYADILYEELGVSAQKIAGSGAAEGLGAGLIAFIISFFYSLCIFNHTTAKTKLSACFK
jgi:glycerate kinase